MTARRRLAMLALAATAVAATLGGGRAGAALPPSPSSAGPPPTAFADRQVAQVGELVRVQGLGWGVRGSGVVTVAVCGNDALDDSADCDLASAASGAIRENGAFFAGIVIHRPALPCPCVLRVSSTQNAHVVKIPVAIVGMPTVEPHQQSAVNRAVAVSNVKITGSGPLSAWFGAAPKRELSFTVRNTGDVTLHDPTVDLAFGRGDQPSGFLDAPNVGDLAPGRSKSFTVEIKMLPLSFGTYKATVHVDPIGGVSSSGSATTTTYPWGLFVIGLVLLQWILVSMRNGLRRFLHRNDPPIDGVGGPGDGAAGGTDSSPSAAEGAPADAGWTSQAEPAGVARAVGVRLAGGLAALVLAGALVGGCSSSSGSSGQDAKGCSLTAAQAKTALGTSVTAAKATPVTGFGTEVQSCEYHGADRIASLTVFKGQQAAVNLSRLVGKATKVPDLGQGGVCTSGKGSSRSTGSCIFFKDGNSWIVGVDVPTKEYSTELQAKALAMSRQLASGT